MIKILNQNRQTIAHLKNAFRIGYEKRLNELWFASFSLPLDDTNVAKCEPFNFVEITDDMTGENIGLFRIEPSRTIRNESAGVVEFELYHVFSTLLDDVLFGYHQTTNWTTTQNIDYILSQQTTKHWRRGNVAFTRYFSYKYENENGLLAPMYAIPQPFDKEYQWTYNTQYYPWTVGLEELSTKVTCEVRYAKNMREIERQVETNGVVNRIYALGAGEGVNQLSIRDANNGVPYLEDAVSVAKYGRKSYVWVDRRFEDAQSLKDNAADLLNKWKQPKVVYKVKAADLSVLTGSSIDKFTEGALVRIVDPDFGVITQRIHVVKKPDITGAPGEIELEIGSMVEGVHTTLVDAEKKIRVNEAYTQGSTNILNYDYNDNADANHPATLDIWIPNDLVNINELNLTYKLEKFRAYSQATLGGGSTTVTSSAGGGTVKSTSSGGGQTTSAGGSNTLTSSSGGNSTQTSSFVSPGFFVYSSPPVGVGTGTIPSFNEHNHAVEITDDRLGHNHTVSIPAHNHTVNTPAHTHTVSNHTHSITIEDHSHNITIPDHTHDLKFGIYELGSLPNSVTIKVDGNTVPVTANQAQEINLIPYLAKDGSGKVTRGTWHRVEIKPSGLARVTASAVSRLFVSSHIGGTY
ncbi:phage tail protein [Rossellomorea aquimaris]|uniref:phage tail spike protein n=1 Tax=Rossellomorea aquimaris TaxID=189382 RepID=UPI001CD64F59|nr:phage tail spike protein [Rossellomorea aquimaris]MCA1059755.1 phage tail protein [Rossellomorea aquimaris]